jgi:hypothetical protein
MMAARLFDMAKERTPELPWCQDDPEILGSVMMNFIYDQEVFYKRWSQKWFENFQFVYGNHDMKWSQKWSVAFDSDFMRSERSRSINRKSNTNLSRMVVESLASFIFGNMPTWSAKTSEESDVRGKRYAELVQKMLDAFANQLVLMKDIRNAAAMFATFGQIGGRIDWDKRGGQMKAIPQYQKVKKPIYRDGLVQNDPFGLLTVPKESLDENGQPLMDESWEAIMGADGRQLVEWMFTGGPRVTVLSPLEYRRAIGSTGMHKTPYVQHIRLMDYDEYLYEFSSVQGATSHFKTVSPTHVTSDMLGFAVRQFLRMHFTTPPNLRDADRRIESLIKGNLFRHKVLVIDHFDKPNYEMWPKGRRLVCVNGKCTHVAEPEYQTNKIDGWHPFVEAQWLNISPNSIATGPLNDVIDQNKELNIADSLIATSMQRNMGSHLLIRTGTGLDPQSISGTPGEILEVNGNLQDAALWLHDSQPFPPAVTQIREQKQDAIYQLSGANDALRGERSKGVSSGYALRQLQEREQARLIPARNEFAWSFVAPMAEKLIQCIKYNVQSLDSSVMGYMKRHAAGGFEEEDVVAFLSTPMDYGVEITIEPDSMMVKSKATHQANLMELATKGPAQQRVSQDAAVLDKFLDEFDAQTLRDGSAVHRDRAERENEIFADIAKLGPDRVGVPMPQIMFEDDDMIHMDLHTQHVVRNASGLQKNPMAMREMLIHIEMHRIQDKEKQGQVPPTTTDNMPAMYAAASQMPRTPPQQVVNNKVQMDQQNAMKNQQQEQQQPQKGGQQQPPGAKPPQAASAPAPVGSGGPRQTQGGAPSQNTPQGRNPGTMAGGGAR